MSGSTFLFFLRVCPCILGLRPGCPASLSVRCDVATLKARRASLSTLLKPSLCALPSRLKVRYASLCVLCSPRFLYPPSALSLAPSRLLYSLPAKWHKNRAALYAGYIQSGPILRRDYYGLIWGYCFLTPVSTLLSYHIKQSKTVHKTIFLNFFFLLFMLRPALWSMLSQPWVLGYYNLSLRKIRLKNSPGILGVKYGGAFICRLPRPRIFLRFPLLF